MSLWILPGPCLPRTLKAVGASSESGIGYPGAVQAWSRRPSGIGILGVIRTGFKECRGVKFEGTKGQGVVALSARLLTLKMLIPL